MRNTPRCRCHADRRNLRESIIGAIVVSVFWGLLFYGIGRWAMSS